MRAAIGTAGLALVVTALAPTPVWAQSPPEAAPAIADQTLQTVTVSASRNVGGGLIETEDVSKAVSTVSAAFIGEEAPTENAFQLVSLLPGANVASSDPYGVSPNYSLALRGLGQDEIGVLLEGAPQNDIGYYYAYPSQFVDNENVRQVSLSPGSIDLESPIINGAGGLLSVFLNDPAEVFGGLADVSYGSYNERRGFLRLDSGMIGESGLRGFISYSKTEVDNWRGYGHDKKQHVDFKVVDEWGSGNRFSLSASYNDAVTSGYPQPTLAQWSQFGRAFNYDHSYVFGDTNYWKLYVATFRDLYFSSPTTFRLADDLTLDLTSYVQTGYGNSPYGTELTTTGNYFGTEPIPEPLALPDAQSGTAVVLGNFTGNQFRAGAVAKLSYLLGAHTLFAGLWYDYADDDDIESFTPVGANGDPIDLWGYPEHNVRLSDGRVFTALDDHTRTQIQSFFLGDTISLLDNRLRFELGFKGVYVSRDGTNGLPGPQYSVSLNDFQALPRGAVRYRVDAASEIYADVATNFRSPNEYALYNTYYGGALTGTGNPHLRDEYSVSEEVGYRYAGEVVLASTTFFNYDFANRQIATIVLLNGAQVNETINAGSQTSRGVDAEIGLVPVRGVSPYLSAEFLDATIGNNIPSGGDYVRTAGKTAVRSPKLQLGLGLNYDAGGLFANLIGKYVGRQYATFDNDETLADHAELDGSIGYRIAGLGPARTLEIRLNLINITDEKSLSGVASPTTNAKPTIAVYGKMIPGSPPTYYIGPGFAGSFTLTARF